MKNKYANWGFWSGIASIFLFEIGIIPLLSIILSIIGLTKLKEYNGDGKTKAVFGLILGLLYMIANLNQYGHF